jgi:hypothetical protein
VEFYINDQLAAVRQAAPYVYRWAVSRNSYGYYAVKALAYDKAGNIGQRIKDYLPESALYADVRSDYWALSYIVGLSNESIMNGYANGKFKPADNISRMEFAKLVVRSMGWGLVTPEQQSFDDVSKDCWAYSFVETAQRHGVLDGYGNRRFRPDKPISRAEIAKIFAIAKGLKATTANDQFSDITDSWAKGYINACTEYGIVNGYANKRFKPEANAKRAEAAKMVYVAIDSE